jgi:hypothetical protein
VRDHGIVSRVGVFGDVEIFLYHTSRIGEESPVSADSAAIFVGLGDIVGADGDQPAIGNLEFAVKLDQQLGLSAVLGAIASAAEHENHRMLPLQFGELPAFRGVVGKLVVGEDGSGDNVRSHGES